MNFELFKILNQKHVSSLLNGDLFMNTLQFFRSIDNPAQGDPLEGACKVIRKDQTRQVGLRFGEEFLQSIDDKITLLSEMYGFNNLFCLYCLQIDHEKKLIQRPDERLKSFVSGDAKHKVVVHIKDTGEFLRRLDAALQKATAQHDIEYGIYGKVEYLSTWLNADVPGNLSAFRKEPRFSYQNEWRLCVLRYARSQSAFTLSIGDLHDIAEEIPLEELFSYPETHYPGHQIVENIHAQRHESYCTFSSSNAVNNLMSSYQPQLLNTPTLSDQAKADWHYTQYLDLNDRQDEIEPYLKSRLEACKDLEHMELLANYRLSIGEWVEATDAFCYMLQNSPDKIHEDPRRFFFQLHTILMRHHEAADAGRLLEIAKSKYSLPEDISLIMESDCLLALGFFDKAAAIFEKMYGTSDDPILDYDLAVCYLYLLNFEESQKHLDRYKASYSSSMEVVEKIRNLQNLLSCLTAHRTLASKVGEHILKDLTWDSATENLLTQPRVKELYLGIDELWKIETAQKWDILNDKEIIVCTMTVARIIELYQQTNDPVFYRIIEHIRTQQNITILSPDLSYYLLVDAKSLVVQPHNKMEQALYLQEFASRKLEDKQPKID